jgi:hypothetical protein
MIFACEFATHVVTIGSSNNGMFFDSGFLLVIKCKDNLNFVVLTEFVVRKCSEGT